MVSRSRVRTGSVLFGLGTAIVGLVVLAGCGGSGGTSTTTATQPSAVGHDAIRAPKTTELRHAMSVRISRSVVRSVGWQVACSAKGRRVTAEAVRGQRTGSGEVAGFKGGSPSIWVHHNRDGSLSISCR